MLINYNRKYGQIWLHKNLTFYKEVHKVKEKFGKNILLLMCESFCYKELYTNQGKNKHRSRMAGKKHEGFSKEERPCERKIWKKKVWLHLESKKCRLKRDTFFSLSDCHRLKRIVPSLASVWGKQGFSLIAHVNVHWTDVPME